MKEELPFKMTQIRLPEEIQNAFYDNRNAGNQIKIKKMLDDFDIEFSHENDKNPTGFLLVYSETKNIKMKD